MPDQQSAIFAIADRYVDEIAALDPFGATEMGVPGHDADVSDLSPAAQEEQAALMRRTLAALDAAQAQGGDDELARAVMRDALSGEVERIAAGDYFYEVRNTAGPIQTLVEVFELMPRANEEDWRNIISRLEKLPEAANTLQARLEEGMRRRQLSARRQVEEAIRQLTRFAGNNPEVAPAFAGLAHDLEESEADSPALRAELERAIGHGRQAFVAIHGFLTDRYLPVAPVQEAAGLERYARAARRFLGSELDLEETYAWGWEEVARLLAEMRRTADRIQAGAGVAEAAEVLDTDSERTLEGEERLLAWLQELQDRTIAALDRVQVDIPAPARRVEACIAPPGGALAQYYTAPSEDFSRPGRTWYPTGGHTQFHRWRDTTTAYHEGVPGHHLQIALALAQAEHLSRFQRVAVWYPGHGEGWALYAERLMAELSYLDDPGDYLGMLIGQMLRAVRVVVDIGMHLQLPIPRGAPAPLEAGAPWDYDRMLAALTEVARLPADEAQSETVRYLGWPGQAIAYKVGERAWLRIREESRARHGDATAIRGFGDERLIVNMSTWESLAALGDFVYRSAHTAVMRNRRKWFAQLRLYVVLWWVPAGHRPSVAEAEERLRHLDEHGPTPNAFTFQSPYPAPDSAQPLAAREEDLCPV
jgi:uncharacterized protein (DUF885 family)